MSLSRFWKRRFWNTERARELESYIEIETDENISLGMSPAEARHRANCKLGNPTLIGEEIYRMNTLELIDSTWRDFLYSARQLRLSPGFAAVAALSLALGIGANTAIFQLLDAVRLRTLAVPHPEQLADIRIVGGNGGLGLNNGRYSNLTDPLWDQIRVHRQSFTGTFAWALTAFPVGRGADLADTPGIWASGELFPVLGVRPFRGRLFTLEDDRPGCGLSKIVISYGFWKTRFGGLDSAIGSKVEIDDRLVEIIGVTPPTFTGLTVGDRFDIAAPLCVAYTGQRNLFWLSVMGRLKPGYTIDKATAELNALSPGLMEATSITGYNEDAVKRYKNFRLAAYPASTGVSALRDQYDTTLWMLLGLTGMVLLIACANLANLLLARASVREREVAVRLALGCSRNRLIRFLLSESLLLAVTGAIIGGAVAQLLSRSIVSFLAAQDDSLVLNMTPDWRVITFTAGLTVLTCIAFGLAPALRASAIDPGTTMKSGGRGSTTGRERFSFQRVLISSQIALSLLLLTGALLFMQSFRNLVTLDPGFRESGIVLGSVSFGKLQIPRERIGIFQRQLLETIQSAPRVESAATSTTEPLSGQSWTMGMHSDADASNRGANGWSKVTWVSPEYFATMGIPLLAGRNLSLADTDASERVAVVNQTFARKVLGGGDPIGRVVRTVTEPDYPATTVRIVGLVKDVKYSGLREEIPQGMYAPAAQDPNPHAWTFLFVRSNAPIGEVISLIKQRVATINPDIRTSIHSLETQVEDGLTRERLMAFLSIFFGAIAAVLAMIGIYGVISYIVARRGNEIGVRIALGATRGQVIKMVVGDASKLLLIGIGTGTVVILIAGRGASALLFGLKAGDPWTLAGAVVLLAFITALAAYLPARRAARIDAMQALRSD